MKRINESDSNVKEFNNHYIYFGNIDSKEKVIFENSITVLGNVNVSALKAKYSIYIMGELKVDDKADIEKDFFCKYDITANCLNVKGDLVSLKSIHSNKINIDGNLIGEEVSVEDKFVVKKNIILKKILSMNDIRCGNSLISLKELDILNGKIYSNDLVTNSKLENVNKEISGKEITISTENIPKEKNPNLLINLQNIIHIEKGLIKALSKYKEMLNSITTILEKKVDYNILDWQEIKELFEKFRKYSSIINSYYLYFNKILKYSDYSKLNTIIEYLDLLSLKKQIPPFFYKIDLVGDVLNLLEPKKKILDQIKIPVKNTKKIKLVLSKFSESVDLLTEKELKILLTRLFLKINNTEMIDNNIIDDERYISLTLIKKVKNHIQNIKHLNYNRIYKKNNIYNIELILNKSFYKDSFVNVDLKKVEKFIQKQVDDKYLIKYIRKGV